MSTGVKLLYDETLVSFIDNKIVIVQLWMLEEHFASADRVHNINRYKQLPDIEKKELFSMLKREHLLYNDESEWDTMLLQHESDIRTNYLSIDV